MPSDKQKRDNPGHPLELKQPVAVKAVVFRVVPGRVGHVQTINSVIENGQPDTKQLQKEDKRQSVQPFDLLYESFMPVMISAVIGEQMLDHKSANRNNS
ncbi:hypothetical protein D3C71_2014560 [compost metagenome]